LVLNDRRYHDEHLADHFHQHCREALAGLRRNE
jgi:hypothetical protein